MLVFTTPGLIPLDAFTVFGMSAKPATQSPIGYFGTGLKYAVAITLRLGGTFRMWRGETEYEFYPCPKDFRGQEFRTVRMRKRNAFAKNWRSEQLPFTTELGRNWESWMVLRELESNTRDEGGSTRLHASSELTSPPIGPDRTVIAVDCDSVEEAYHAGDAFLDVDGHEMVHETPLLQVYDRPSPHIYMRGIRVMTPTRECRFTYNFTHQLDLSENRTPLYQFLVGRYVLNALRGMEHESALRELFALGDGRWFETGLDFDEPEEVSPAFRRTLSVAMSGGGAFSRAATFHNRLVSEDLTREIEVCMPLEDWVSMVATREVTESQRELILGVLRDSHVSLSAVGLDSAQPEQTVEDSDGIPF